MKRHWFSLGLSLLLSVALSTSSLAQSGSQEKGGDIISNRITAIAALLVAIGSVGGVWLNSRQVKSKVSKESLDDLISNSLEKDKIKDQLYRILFENPDGVIRTCGLDGCIQNKIEDCKGGFGERFNSYFSSKNGREKLRDSIDLERQSITSIILGELVTSREFAMKLKQMMRDSSLEMPEEQEGGIEQTLKNLQKSIQILPQELLKEVIANGTDKSTFTQSKF